MNAERPPTDLFDDIITNYDGICMTCHRGWGDHQPTCSVSLLGAALRAEATRDEVRIRALPRYYMPNVTAPKALVALDDVLAASSPEPVPSEPDRDPLSPQWEDCKVCGGDHWTKDHPAEPVPSEPKQWYEPDGTPVEPGLHAHHAHWDHEGRKWDPLPPEPVPSEPRHCSGCGGWVSHSTHDAGYECPGLAQTDG